jgi:metallo-beta-lactamase class B
MHDTPHSSAPIQGCCSAEILAKFVEFGKTGMMPQDLAVWLDDPVSQYIKPWKPFDNVHFVGVCWVSAWLVETPDGAVLIDTMCCVDRHDVWPPCGSVDRKHSRHGR